jgi:hydroxymethylbilane synthase
MLNTYGDPAADACVKAERALLAELHGGCSVPVGACALTDDGRLKLTAQVASLDGTQQVFGTATGTDPVTLGRDLAARLLEEGAAEILRAFRVTA